LPRGHDAPFRRGGRRLVPERAVRTQRGQRAVAGARRIEDAVGDLEELPGRKPAKDDSRGPDEILDRCGPFGQLPALLVVCGEQVLLGLSFSQGFQEPRSRPARPETDGEDAAQSAADKRDPLVHGFEFLRGPDAGDGEIAEDAVPGGGVLPGAKG
jgi:hypothetical protein